MKHRLTRIVRAAVGLRGMYWVYLYSVGNPDYGQCAPLSEPCLKSADTLPGVRALCLAYIRDWDLGGGNWPGGIVGTGRVIVGHVSYNGRLWEGLPDNRNAREIPIDAKFA